MVVGGGITGCSAAWHLANSGADVILLEQHDLNTQASGRNAGSLHGQIQHAPFVERGPDWARGFLPSLRFLADSLAIWSSLGDVLQADLEVSLNGGLLVAETDGQLADIERKVAIEREAEIESEILDAADLQKLAPYISEEMVGAQLCIVEGKANPLLAAPAFAASAKKMGARIETNRRVDKVERDGTRFDVTVDGMRIKADRLVIAAGNDINRFSNLWGARLPIEDEPIQVGATEPIAPLVHHLVYFAGDKLTFKQACAGTLLIGGGWPADVDSHSGRTRVNPSSLSSNMEVALRVVPALSGVQLIRTWAGVGLATPDLAPIVGSLGVRGLTVGVYPHMGLTAGPLMGNVLSDIALDRNPSFDVSPFDPDRF